MTSVLKKPKAPQQTPAELDAARKEAGRLIDKARAYIVLDQAFFATIMLKHPFTERLDVPTLAVTPQGAIFYNPNFIKQYDADQIVFAVTHEILHYAGGHAQRRQGRDPRKWNYACDAWNNATLQAAGVGKFIPGCVNIPGSHLKTVEDIYAELPDNDDDDGEDGEDGGIGSDDPLFKDLDYDNLSETEKAEVEAQRKMDVAEAAATAKIRGKLPGVLAKFAEETIEQRTPWFDILERYMTERVRTDISWSRPARRYMPDFYQPSMDNGHAMGEVVIQVDISGSVSREEIKHYNGHIKRIVETCKPSKVHVIYTDTVVQKHEEFDKPEDVQINYHSGGGTHMPAGFKWVEDQGIDPEVVITLTDGFTDWDTEPPFPTVHCISSAGQKAPYGVNVHFDMNEQ
jgi:predicted metal-dependent peptidase